MAPFIDRSKKDIYPFIDPAFGLRDAARGKKILVTGAGTGIGKTIALKFALAGASTLILTGRRIQKLEESRTDIIAAVSAAATAPATETTSCVVKTIICDVTDEESVTALFATLEEMGDVPDVVVNNAGVAGSWAKIVDSALERWWGDYDSNVKSVYLVSRAYLRLLRQKPGTILNLSSSVSYGGKGGTVSSYATSKAAVNRLTEFIHDENSSHGVICTAFHPGGIAGTELGPDGPSYLASLLTDTADLAGGTAVYLSTPRAAYLGGRMVLSNWDMEELETHKDRIVDEDLLKMRVSLGGDVVGSLASTWKGEGNK